MSRQIVAVNMLNFSNSCYRLEYNHFLDITQTTLQDTYLNLKYWFLKH